MNDRRTTTMQVFDYKSSKKSNRTLRIGQLMRKELAVLLQSPKLDLKHHFITVTEVRLNRDLKLATIWVSVLGDSKKRREVMEVLAGDTRKIRYLLADKIKMRRMPELSFELDETLDNVERIERVLHKQGLG